MQTFETLLSACGVTDETLSAAHGRALDEQGYLVSSDVVDAGELEQLRAVFESSAQPGGGKQSGTRHVELSLTDPVWDRVYTEPRVLAAAQHVVRRPFRILHVSGRDPLPGYGLQGLHTDWPQRAPSEPFGVVTALWLLDDFTPENGATRVVPGSHLVPRPLPKSMQAPNRRHPDQRIVLAPAGSVLLLNGHLWHSGTRNDTQLPRRVLQCQFLASDLVRPDQLGPAVPERLTPAARYLFGARPA